jgi:hypothetical protein
VSTARLRQQTIRALADGRIPRSSADDIVQVSPGNDLRIWVSFNTDTDTDSDDETLRTSANRVVDALAVAGLHLESVNPAEHRDTVERLMRGEILSVAEIAGTHGPS